MYIYISTGLKGTKRKATPTDKIDEQILCSLQSGNDDEEELFGKSIAANFQKMTEEESNTLSQ